MSKIYKYLHDFFSVRYFVHRVPETFRERARLWANKSILLRLIILSPIFYCMVLVFNSAQAMNISWFTDPESHYKQSVYEREQAEFHLIREMQSEYKFRGDLAFSKAVKATELQKKALKERDTEKVLELSKEIERLSSVIDETKSNIEFLEKDGLYFKVCVDEKNCFTRAFLK
jgi:hypothetical protein